VILDLNLPRVPGTEILRHIRSDVRLAGVQVVVVTAYHNLVAEVEGDADLVLLKPVTFSWLRDRIRELPVAGA
jgi:DNA-binding response OmpR family regulator